MDKLEMCHRIEFADRLAVSRPTLPVADLLLSKLQIVKINRKDVLDALVLLAEHPLRQDDGAQESTQGEGAISLPRITAHTSNDWGWWRTVTGNLKVLQEYLDTEFTEADLDVGPRPVRYQVREQLAGLRDAIEAAPKSTRWKLRSKVGDRQQWYVEPEEVGHN